MKANHVMNTRYSLLIATTAALCLLPGCGSGSGPVSASSSSTQVSTPSAAASASTTSSSVMSVDSILQSVPGAAANGADDSSAAFVPNYLASISNPLSWPHTSSAPVTLMVSFARDANYTPLRHASAVQGFDMWTQALGNASIAWQETSTPTSADIIVSFDPSTNNGLTTYTYNGTTLQSGTMIKIGVKSIGAVDIQGQSAHEFGHALGITAHSPDPTDLMYGTYIPGQRDWTITQNDLDTLKSIYHDLFGRGVTAAHRSGLRASGPSRVISIQ